MTPVLSLRNVGTLPVKPVVTDEVKLRKTTAMLAGTPVPVTTKGR